MLIQRLQISEPYAEAAIAHNLVDLALKAPESSFLEVIRAFSSLSLSKYSEDPRFSNNMVKPFSRPCCTCLTTTSTDSGCTD
jgi:phosphatidylinositol 4-kinase A